MDLGHFEEHYRQETGPTVWLLMRTVALWAAHRTIDLTLPLKHFGVTTVCMFGERACFGFDSLWAFSSHMHHGLVGGGNISSFPGTRHMWRTLSSPCQVEATPRQRSQPSLQGHGTLLTVASILTAHTLQVCQGGSSFHTRGMHRSLAATGPVCGTQGHLHPSCSYPFLGPLWTRFSSTARRLLTCSSRLGVYLWGKI